MFSEENRRVACRWVCCWCITFNLDIFLTEKIKPLKQSASFMENVIILKTSSCSCAMDSKTFKWKEEDKEKATEAWDKVLKHLQNKILVDRFKNTFRLLVVDSVLKLDQKNSNPSKWISDKSISFSFQSHKMFDQIIFSAFKEDLWLL